MLPIHAWQIQCLTNSNSWLCSNSCASFSPFGHPKQVDTSWSQVTCVCVKFPGQTDWQVDTSQREFFTVWPPSASWSQVNCICVKFTTFCDLRAWTYEPTCESVWPPITSPYESLWPGLKSLCSSKLHWSLMNFLLNLSYALKSSNPYVWIEDGRAENLPVRTYVSNQTP